MGERCPKCHKTDVVRSVSPWGFIFSCQNPDCDWVWPTYRIAAGVCVKGMAETLPKTIESLLGQTAAGNAQLIFVTPSPDDVATRIIQESLPQLAQKYADVSIHYDGGGGLAAARQTAVERCQAPYIAWVDGDHYIPPKYLSRAAAYMDSNPEVGACNTIPLWMGSRCHQILEGLAWAYYTYSVMSRKNLRQVGSAGGIYRVKAIIDAGGYDRRFKHAAEDGYITYRMSAKGWKMAVDVDNYYYHMIRPRWRDVWKEYYNWGRGSCLENKVNRNKRFDMRLLRFALSPLAGLKHSLAFRGLVKELRERYPIQLDGFSASLAAANVVFYAWKRYAWLLGYVREMMA